MKGLRFGEIEDSLPRGLIGLYEIRTIAGLLLKVGISADLRRRLIDHRQSRQGALRLKAGGSWARPSDVRSTRSILAKHLYFDRSLSIRYDLRTEIGRRAFLIESCVVDVTITESRAAARELERRLEATGRYRYQRKITVR